LASNDEEFNFKSLQDPESIVKYLDALGQGLSSGRLFLGTKKKKLILEPNGLLNLDVKAKRKERKVKLEIKISWTVDKGDKQAHEDSLEIKAGKKEK